MGTAAPRQITVVGEADVQARPDTATVNIGVETDARNAQQALAENNEQTTAIINRIKEMGIESKDVQTSNFSIYPRYNNDGSQITGYQVNNTVNVTIRNLDQTGDLLDQVVQLGANNIYGISFHVDDPSALLDQAREQAILNAKTRATAMARSAGAEIGDVLVITDQVGSMPPVVPMLERAEMDAVASVPVEAGEQTFTMHVQVTFALR